MLLDSGIIEIYTITNTAENGKMPSYSLTLKHRAYYGERTIGFNRYYARLGRNEQIDMLVRIWQTRNVHIGDVAIIDSVQYRITNIQHLADESNLRVSDLTLERMAENYDIT